MTLETGAFEMSKGLNLNARELVTEAQMRDAQNPRPQTQDELHAYIEELVKREHDYGTCVYAMSLAAVAAYQYVAHKLGVTGFQASCADLDILKRTRHLKGPFAIVDAEKMLFPQYDLPAQLEKWLAEWKPWAADEARKLLANRSEQAHEGVVAHWRRLAEDE